MTTCILIWMVVTWFGSLFFQSFFLHRYCSHKMFSIKPFWEKFFYIMTWIFQGPSFLSARSYAIMHRMHHSYSDSEEDPHSPMHNQSIIAMMLKTAKIYGSIVSYQDKYPNKYKKNLFQWDQFDRYTHHMAAKILTPQKTIAIIPYLLTFLLGESCFKTIIINIPQE